VQIPDQGLRTAVSTVDSIWALIDGVTCRVESAVYGGMGYEQKVMVCLHAVGICAEITSGVNEKEPVNPTQISGKLADEAVDKPSA